ncbi:MAG: hypothetical protein ABGW78_09320 [Pirellulales bacterium]
MTLAFWMLALDLVVDTTPDHKIGKIVALALDHSILTSRQA